MNQQILLRFLKPLLARTLYRKGVIRSVLWGPCRGLRYRIFADGLAPLYGGWEPDAQCLMVEHMRLGSTAYDIGANYGIHTLLMARLVGQYGHVYAFEPVPEIYSHLKENININGFTNVNFFQLAIAGQTGTDAFFAGHHGGAGHLEAVGDKRGKKLEVRTVTLDEFVLAGNNQPPDLIKIDVEGAESKVLSGAEKVLETFRPILLVDLHNPEQDVAVGQILLKFQYEAYRTNDGSKIRDLSKGWPAPDGLWGQFIAFPMKRRIVTECKTQTPCGS